MGEIKDLGKIKCVDEETGEVSYIGISTTMEVISQTETKIVLNAVSYRKENEPCIEL